MHRYKRLCRVEEKQRLHLIWTATENIAGVEVEIWGDPKVDFNLPVHVFGILDFLGRGKGEL